MITDFEIICTERWRDKNGKLLVKLLLFSLGECHKETWKIPFKSDRGNKLQLFPAQAEGKLYRF